jgi:ubiquinone/menaquinone biosynthesis C-methylase UbiE
MFPGADLTAIDVSDVYLATARKNLAGYRVTYLKGELPSLGLPPASFDRVVCTEVLEHTVDPEAILAEIRRVLRPGGWGVVTVPNDPLIDRLRAEGQTMVIVEQSLNVALAVSDRAVFLEKGQVRFEGPSAELAARDDLARAVFLGAEGGG